VGGTTGEDDLDSTVSTKRKYRVRLQK
jgi:hypothetical protein